jgi:hypothetical protein
MEKCCTKCNVFKSLNEFGKDIRMKDSLKHWCKSCSNKSTKNWILNNPEKQRQHVKKWQLNNPEKHLQKHLQYVKKYTHKKQGIYEWYEDNICLYVGQSTQLNGRVNSHKSLFKFPELSAKSRQAYLYEALRQHQNPQIRIIEECPSEVLLEREQYYIDTKKPLYNIKNI